MKVILTNLTADTISTDLGVLEPLGTLEGFLTPAEMYTTGQQLYNLVAASKLRWKQI